MYLLLFQAARNRRPFNPSNSQYHIPDPPVPCELHNIFAGLSRRYEEKLGMTSSQSRLRERFGHARAMESLTYPRSLQPIAGR